MCRATACSGPRAVASLAARASRSLVSGAGSAGAVAIAAGLDRRAGPAAPPDRGDACARRCATAAGCAARNGAGRADRDGAAPPRRPGASSTARCGAPGPGASRRSRRSRAGDRRRRRARQRADPDGPARRGMGGGAMIAVHCIVLVVLIAVRRSPAGASVRVLREYERAVVFRLGRLIAIKGPGPRAADARRSTGWCASRCAPSRSTSRRRTSSRATTCPPASTPSSTSASSTPTRRSSQVESFLQGDLADRPDDAALGARQGRARHAALRARAAQRGPAADHRRADRAVGDQGHRRSRSRTSASRRRCSARWPARPRPSASAARR